WENEWEKQSRDTGTTFTEMQYAYYQQIKHALAARDRAFAELGSDVSAWRQRQREIREILWKQVFFPLEELAGARNPGESLPPPPARGFGIFSDHRGFQIHSMVLETRPGAHVPISVWVPARPTPGEKMPLVIIAKLAINLVLGAGLAVLMFDPIAQGERHQFIGRPCTRAHDAIGQQLFLLSRSLAAYFIHDVMRIIDFVVGKLEYVDASRLAMVGTSGGGMLTAYVGALDDRIHSIVIGSYLGTWRMLRSTACHHDAEQIWWQGVRPLLLEKVDLVIARAPKPSLRGAGRLRGPDAGLASDRRRAPRVRHAGSQVPGAGSGESR
ncbi:unnamed protein product, partial [Polarella glacialis]